MAFTFKRLAIASIASASLLVACFGHGTNGPAIGESTKGGGGRNPSDGGIDNGLVDGAAALPEAYRTKFTKVNKARMVSQGHASGRWEVDIWANEAAAKAIADKSRAVPVGAVVVEEHFERSATQTGDKPRGPVMVMEKRAPGFSKEHGDWRWAVVGSQGQLVKDGTIETCAGCHDDAPMDGLFPIVE